MRYFLIDTDTASDDAVALVMALNYPDVQIEAITVVGGNVPVKQGVQNALYTLELCGKQIPVYQGMSRPLMRPLQTAQFVHGEDGMGDIGLPLSGRRPMEEHGVVSIIETITHCQEKLTIVALGPLTNIAMAVSMAPSIVSQVDRCVIMGGTGQGYGNITPVGEYNVWADPEAAKIVFESGLPITMVGWDVSRTYATFDQEDAEQLRSVGTPLAHFCVDIQKTLIEFDKQQTKLGGFDLPDPIAMAVALDPTVATLSKSLFVAIETGDGLCRGQSVVDHLMMTDNPANAHIVFEASREKFLQILYHAVQA
jgi:purine nucleosidase